MTAQSIVNCLLEDTEQFIDDKFRRMQARIQKAHRKQSFREPYGAEVDIEAYLRAFLEHEYKAGIKDIPPEQELRDFVEPLVRRIEHGWKVEYYAGKRKPWTPEKAEQFRQAMIQLYAPIFIEAGETQGSGI